MKLLAALLLVGVTSAPALAGGPAVGYRSRGGYAEEEKCYRKEYREEYVPGTSKNPGYVRTYKKRVRVACERPQFMPQTTPYYHNEEQHPNVGRTR
jgi:hypothetical protein